MRAIRIAFVCSSLLAVSGWAQAQTVAPVLADAPAGNVDLQAQAPAPKPAAVPAASLERSWSPLLQGGLVFQSAHAGITFGGGVLASPFQANRDLEILGDVNFVRFGGANNWMASGNLVYDMKSTGTSAHPYFGGGLAINRTGAGTASSTSGNFEILGGVSAPLQGGRAVRGEVRLIFTSGAVTTVLLAGITF